MGFTERLIGNNSPEAKTPQITETPAAQSAEEPQSSCFYILACLSNALCGVDYAEIQQPLLKEEAKSKPSSSPTGSTHSEPSYGSTGTTDDVTGFSRERSFSNLETNREIDVYSDLQTTSSSSINFPQSAVGSPRPASPR